MIDFNKFWNRYPLAPEYRNRYYVTRDLWQKRTLVAQQAMIDMLAAKPDTAIGRNPFFFVQDFPEPTPTNYNGRALPNEPVVIARYNGKWGTYKVSDAELFRMEIATISRPS